MPKVLNKYKMTAEEFKGAIYCGRGSDYGNPFKIGDLWNGKPMTRDVVCDRFEKEILPTLHVSHLRDHNLICFCKPKRCHCDAILEKANS